ncbi:MAG: glycosyltransferase [Candidatus Jacksonbacteria bacterium]|nr:glycosyltransferase [Candidatus Jacksonbacteria bacterium]MBT6062948.1 glycosyltransferase [Anaerolineae bacterium]
MLPKVSILIPCYNQKDVIEQTLQSALAQTYENIEIIISDDASTDNTPQILQDWQARYPQKLKVFLHTENLGVTQNHTRGLQECTGDFIAFLDGDDLFLPEKLEKQINYMLSEPDCTISYHNVDVFDSATGNTLYLWAERFGTRQGDIRDLVRYGNYLPAVGVIVKRKDLPINGYDKRINVYSDWFLWLCVLGNGKGKICYLDETLAKYRRHSDNLTNVPTWKFIDQNLVLDLAKDKWPELSFFVRMRRAEIKFMQAFNALALQKYGPFSKHLLSALLFGIPFFPWIRLIFREVLFLYKNKNKADVILKSILARGKKF